MRSFLSIHPCWQSSRFHEKLPFVDLVSFSTMCLLFFCINDDYDKDELRLVLANNRDEFWNRPTKTADFWTTHRSCIGGLDDKPGREGGTWFGANRRGRIACVVNLFQEQDLVKKGRGFMVTDFLTKGDSIESYTDWIASQRDDYQSFILTLIEIGPTGSKLARVTNDKLTNTPVLFTTPSQHKYFSVGNSHVDFHWRKKKEGEKRFRKIVQTYGTVPDKDRLTEELFDMLADRTRYLPDPLLQKDGHQCKWDQDSIDSMSAMFVWDPNHRCGTRTMTVLTMDGEGNCDYVEKTLRLPVPDDADTLQWSTVHHRYSLQSAVTFPS